MDEQMRGQPLTAYLKAFHQICHNLGRSKCSFPEFLDVRQNVIDELADGRMTIPGGLRQIPDSFLFLAVLATAWQKPLYVSTHCPRPLAVTFVRESGFASLVSPENMVCGDDSPLSKDSPAYWERILPKGSAQRWIGLDDTVHGASWMLRAAGMGLVIVRPSLQEYLAPLMALKHEFNNRLHVLSEFGELFAIGRG